MTPEFIVSLLVIMAIIFGIAYWMGWDQSVRRWRQSDFNRARYIEDLDNQIGYFNEQMEKDPQRAWVDVGIIHALNTVESASEELRDEVNQRRERLS